MAHLVARKISGRVYWSVRDGHGRHIEALGSSPTPEKLRATVKRYSITFPPQEEIESEPAVKAATAKEDPHYVRKY